MHWKRGLEEPTIKAHEKDRFLEQLYLAGDVGSCIDVFIDAYSGALLLTMVH